MLVVSSQGKDGNKGEPGSPGLPGKQVLVTAEVKEEKNNQGNRYFSSGFSKKNVTVG